MIVDKAFIAAGGRGARMGSLTTSFPKALLPVRGRPLIAYSIDEAVNAGVCDLTISIPTEFQGMFASFFSNCYALQRLRHFEVIPPKEGGWSDSFTTHFAASDSTVLLILASEIFDISPLPHMIDIHMVTGTSVVVQSDEHSELTGLLRATANSSATLELDNSVRVLGRYLLSPLFFREWRSGNCKNVIDVLDKLASSAQLLAMRTSNKHWSVRTPAELVAINDKAEHSQCELGSQIADDLTISDGSKGYL